MIDLTYPKLLNLFPEHIAPPRTESASFLIWYLEHYWRLDTLDAIDAVCDRTGDKGVDGIYVDENNGVINIFQSKISQNVRAEIGDVVLKEFKGTLSQFETPEKINNLVSSSTTSIEVINLINKLGLITKVTDYKIKGIFLSNTNYNHDGKLFLDSAPEITFVGKTTLENEYISNQRTGPISTWSHFDISGFSIAEYIANTETRALIAPIKASELISLQGVADQTIFAVNVRGPLGQTQVNKDIVKSIKDASQHKLFPLFHNGVTIICNEVTNDADKISIKDYYVVNGCQSLSSLNNNDSSITSDLRILTKIIQVDVNSKLSEDITKISNNQNGVKARDFKSNHPTQIKLQNEFNKFYSGQFNFVVKRGELVGVGDAISNEEAGLQLMSFDLKEPWATHRKYQVFEDKYVDLFNKPEVNADRIVMCHLFMNIINEEIDSLENKLVAKYVLTKFIVLYIIRLILENDEIGKQLITNPKIFVRETKKRTTLKKCIKQLTKDIIVDLNAETKDFGEDFDYRGTLRDETFVKNLANSVLGSYLKLVQRNRIDSFENEWKKRSK